MKITKDQLLNFLTDLSLVYELPPLVEKVEEVIEALQNEELEIEGYSRNEWVKFDPKDEGTYPPFGRYLCVSSNGGEVDVAYRGDKCTDEIFASLPHDMRYWRPLPPPPGKEGK